MIQVILVNDQLLFQEGMKAILEQAEDYQVIATFDSTGSALKQLEAGTIQATSS